jgi:hypothetical protein
MDGRILASTSVPFRSYDGENTNLALIVTKRITVWPLEGWQSEGWHLSTLFPHPFSLFSNVCIYTCCIIQLKKQPNYLAPLSFTLTYGFVSYIVV